MQKSYLLNPENSKTILILSQPKMCQKYTFLLPRAHFLGATGAPTEPVHESLLKTPILSRPSGGGGWKPILVYSSGPTFELELECELDLT